jgi:hypothetical protein
VKPESARTVPGKTEAEHMSNVLCTVLTLSKDELLEEEARQKHKRERKQNKKPV